MNTYRSIYLKILILTFSRVANLKSTYRVIIYPYCFIQIDWMLEITLAQSNDSLR